MAGPFYFAWSDQGEVFDSGVHGREDESIFSFSLTQAEGDFAVLSCEMPNPKVGLLGAGRNLWCWFSWFDGSAIVPLFNGRLIGVPRSLSGEAVQLDFVARPADFVAQKAALADTLKVAPYWDPIWIDAASDDDPDATLQARTALYDINRTTLGITVTDIISGEDGTINVTGGDAFYDSLSVSYSQAPKLKATAEATVTWTQEGSGTVDLTRQLADAFVDAGSPYLSPLIASLTGDGLFDDWPEAKSDIGSGWSIGAGATIESADWIEVKTKQVTWLRPAYKASDTADGESRSISDPAGTYVYKGRVGAFKSAIAQTSGLNQGWVWQPDSSSTTTQAVDNEDETWVVALPLSVYSVNFPVDWIASRERKETLTVTLEAEVQDLLVDPGDDAEIKVSLSSDRLTEKIDLSGTDLVMPIGDLRRNAYFPTDRGGQSLEYVLYLLRAELLRAARCVDITIDVSFPFAVAEGLSCRKNARISDDRLPGAVATGKIKAYEMRGAPGDFSAKITIACTIGRGGSAAAVAGINTYATDYANDYTRETGGTIDPGTGDLTYESLDNLDVLDDDGIDLFNMTSGDMLTSLTVADGPTAQLDALAIFKTYRSVPSLTGGSTQGGTGLNPPSGNSPPDIRGASYLTDGDTPQSVLTDHPTIVTIDLVPIGNQSFHTDYAPTVSVLKVPAQIDLEAV